MNQKIVVKEGKNSQPSSTEDIEKARQLLKQGQLSAAASKAREILDKDSENIEVLYLLAVIQRYLGAYSDALNTLERLIVINPSYGRAYQEQGHNFKKLQQLNSAATAYEKAVKCNTALLASWRELINLYRQGKLKKDLLVAQAEFERLSKLPAEVLSVSSLINEEKYYQAEKLCRAFLLKNPEHVEAMRLLAMLGQKLSVYDDAEFLLESCVEFDPNDWRARHDYVNILHKRQKYEKAKEQAWLLTQKYPNEKLFQLTYANQLFALGDFEQAIQIYDGAIADYPMKADVYLVRGHALKTIGKLDEGTASYKAAYKARPDFGDAYWSLANLKTYRFSKDEIEQMEQQADLASTSLIDQVHLHFALGKAFEDIGAYGQSFSHYQSGNALKKQQIRYKADKTTQSMRQQIEVCDNTFFEKVKDWGGDYADPIFIVGLPRSGSTLLEQILSSHSQVDGTMELPNIIGFSNLLNGRRQASEAALYPGVMRDLKPENFKKLADKFIKDTRCHRGEAPYFIDKMPNNFIHIGLIHAILPNAKIIDARRHPMSCCFSGFKQLFAEGQEFSYGLEEIATYYKDYAGLMAHWDKVLPGKILRVHYEHLVADLETQVRRILDYCGLPFEQACLDFHKTERAVRTPSSEQVRQPIYQGGLEQWKHFEPYLEILQNELATEIAEYPMPE